MTKEILPEAISVLLRHVVHEIRGLPELYRGQRLPKKTLPVILIYRDVRGTCWYDDEKNQYKGLIKLPTAEAKQLGYHKIRVTVKGSSVVVRCMVNPVREGEKSTAKYQGEYDESNDSVGWNR